MEKKLELEKICREAYKKLSRSENTLGFSSLEANMFRTMWAAYDRAYRLVFEEKIDYFNNNVKLDEL